MDPFDFEALVGRVLEALGYEDVELTQASADGGIDVVARQTQGLTRVEYAVQVKQTPSVGRPVVQRLRGSMKPHQIGIIVTSGQYSRLAFDDAEMQGRPPITLIDGATLVRLMMEYGVGVRRELIPIYKLETLGDSS